MQRKGFPWLQTNLQLETIRDASATWFFYWSDRKTIDLNYAELEINYKKILERPQTWNESGKVRADFVAVYRTAKVFSGKHIRTFTL